jgi:glycosyltransferase involved in cell wall biosynthesis
MSSGLKETNTVHEEMPRIALFLRYLGGGGADQMMVNLAEGFAKHGAKVDLILGDAWGPHLWKVPPEVQLINLNAKTGASVLFKLVQYLKQVQPQALLSTLHYNNEMVLLAKRLAGVPTRIVVREANTPSEEARNLKQLKKQITPVLMRHLYPWADGIVAVSQGVADDIAEVTKISVDRMQVIYNPSVTPQISEKAKEPLDHPWFAPGEPPVILGVGKLQKQKGFPTLIRAFDKVRQARSARLMILGWGPDRPELEALVQALGLEADVAMPDHIKNPYPYMARSAVFVLSSAWEGLPNVLIEALAVGVPVVSTDCRSGPSEILAQGKYGELTPVGDSEAMAAAILRVLAGETRQVNREWLKQFQLEAATRQYMDALGIISTPLPQIL